MQKPEPLSDVDLLVERGVARNRQQAYRLIRERIVPPGVGVVIGRTVRVSPARLEEWLAAGGTAASASEADRQVAAGGA